MVFKLSSTNPDFSLIISKNPASGMQIREIRKGLMFYWFHNGDFCVRFVDNDNDTSYGRDGFEYLDVTRYNSPRFILHAVKDLFDWKNRHEKDTDGHEHSFHTGMVRARRSYADMFTKYFPDFTITWTPVVADNYSLKITTKKPLHHLLNFVNLFMIFTVMRNEEDFFIEEDMVEKYVNCMDVVNVPYFMRYVFKVNFLGNKMLFEKFKPLLQKNTMGEEIQMEYGSSQMMRRDAVKKFIDFKRQVVDVGCGDGFYMSFSQKLKDGNKYIGIDTDQTMLDMVQKQAQKKQFANTAFCSSFESFLASETAQNESDVLLVEVIEHMEKEEAAALMRRILADSKTASLTITTPNADFNRFFLFEEGEMRHDDHKFEFTEQEFRRFVEETGTGDFETKFFNAGDTVNGICSTVGTNIKRNYDRRQSDNIPEHGKGPDVDAAH